MQLSTVNQPWHNFSKSRIVHAKMGHVSPTPPPLGLLVIRTLGLVTINVCAKFEVPIFTCYDNTKDNAKFIKYGKSHIKRIAVGKQPSITLKVIVIK